MPLALYGYIAERNSWRPKTLSDPYRSVLQLQFSGDSRYLAVREQSLPQMVSVFDVTKRRLVIRHEGYSALFVGRDYFALSPMNGYTDVYSLYDGKLLAHNERDFWAYAALPDGKTLLGEKGHFQRFPSQRVAPPADVLTWNFLSAPTSPSMGITRTPTNSTTKAAPFATYGFLPAMPLCKSAPFIGYRTIQLLADGQTLLLNDEMPTDCNEPSRLTFWSIPQKKTLSHLPGTVPFGFTSSPGGLCAWHEDLYGNNTKDSRVIIWNYRTGKRQAVFSFSGTGYRDPWEGSHIVVLALSADGAVLASSYNDKGDIALWDTKTKQLWRLLKGHKASLSHLAFSPDGKTLASAGYDNSLKLWRVK